MASPTSPLSPENLAKLDTKNDSNGGTLLENTALEGPPKAATGGKQLQKKQPNLQKHPDRWQQAQCGFSLKPQ